MDSIAHYEIWGAISMGNPVDSNTLGLISMGLYAYSICEFAHMMVNPRGIVCL